MWTREDIRRRLDPPLIGMVHLAPLPGAPAWDGDLGAVVAAAVRDLDGLAAGGMRAAMMENYHDAPFHPGAVPPETVAAMAVVAAELRRRRPEMLLGVNVLRNDALAALGVAAATGAAFVRVNVHTGSAATDQGVLQGQAHVTVRRRRELGLEAVGILADLRVKHAAPLAARPLAEEADDLRSRGRADGLILSGPATGAAADPAELAAVRAALPRCPLLVGSGVTCENAAELAVHADGAIVGTSLKRDGAIDAGLVRELAAAWRDAAMRGEQR